MNKDVISLSLGDIVEQMSSENGEVGVSKKEIEKRKLLIEDFFEKLMNEVSAGRRVRVKNVGAFSHRLAKEVARNPASNERVPVTKRKRLKFEPSSNSVKILNK